jgi:hypothetical protein
MAAASKRGARPLGGGYDGGARDILAKSLNKIKLIITRITRTNIHS